MADAPADQNAAIAAAVDFAQDIASELDSILITHFTDADTLDRLRPGVSDLATVTAINREVAAIFLTAGVSVFVQRADHAAFRRWRDAAPGHATNPLAWIDRDRLLTGAVALKLLGLSPNLAPRAPTLGKSAGPIADDLVDRYADEDGSSFGSLGEAAIAASRQDVLDLALRKARDRLETGAADVMALEFREMAEAAAVGPSGWADLVALLVALIPGSVPDASGVGAGLAASGAIASSLELRFLPGWRSPDAIAALPATELRQVLLDIIAGAEPRHLPPGDTDDLAKTGFGVLLGVQIDWDIPVWDDVFANGLPDEPEAADEPDATQEDVARDAAFERWRGEVAEASGGCVALELVPPTKVGEEIAAFLDDAGDQAEGLEEIRDFVAMARREASGEDIVCRPEVIGSGLEISLYTSAGRFLDSLTMTADRLPARAEEMLPLIEAFVPILRDTPR